MPGIHITGGITAAIAGDPTIEITTITTSSVGIVEAHNGQLIRGLSSTTQTVTLPNNLPAGFNFTWRQVGSGQAEFVAGSGATRQSYDGTYKTAGSNALVAVFVETNTTGTNAAWVIDGNTGP